MFKRSAVVLSVLSAIVLTCSKNPVAPQTVAPVITLQPQSDTVTVGDSVVFTVVATGNPAPTYQWLKDGIAISGETRSTLFNDSVELADAGIYTVVVSNSQRTVISNPATLTIYTPPSITTQPRQVTAIYAGDSATFTVAATGFPAPTYQWRKNDTAITGAIDSIHVIASALVSDAGIYTVVVTNAAGSVTSNSAFLTVAGNHPPYKPSYLVPANGAIKQSLSPLLDWTGGDVDAGDTVKYDVYLGPANPPTTRVTLLPQTATAYNASGLSYNTTYYWYVLATDGKAMTQGEVWHFTTSVICTSYTFVKKWKWVPISAPQDSFHSLTGIAADANDNIYVISFWNDAIMKFDGNGNYLQGWPTPPGSPRGIDVDRKNGWVYASNDGNWVAKFDTAGNLLGTFGTAGSALGQFSSPIGIAVNQANGDVYVAEQGNHRVQKFDKTWTPMLQWGSAGSGQGQFNGNMAVAVDSNGYVYVRDHGNKRIQKFDLDGNYLLQWSVNDGRTQGDGIWVGSDGCVFSIEYYDSSRVVKYSSAGSVVCAWGGVGSGDGQFTEPSDVVTDSHGNVYTTEWAGNRIQKFAPR